MNETLVHRGPDSEGSVIDGPCGLAMRRLSIIDLAGGDQPIGNEDGSASRSSSTARSTTTASSGTSSGGRGTRFRTHSDTEVLVHLYEERGDGSSSASRHVRVRDLGPPRRRLLLARDRFGIKPLYYRDADGQLSFASELKALLRQPGFSREIDPQALESFLAFNRRHAQRGAVHLLDEHLVPAILRVA